VEKTGHLMFHCSIIMSCGAVSYGRSDPLSVCINTGHHYADIIH